MKKAFTLAELMIVIVAIGIITSVLLPIAFRSTPDKNVLKFKKANSTLLTIIREMVNSDTYFKDGDLGVKKDGTLLDNSSSANRTYFCKVMAQLLSVKNENCSDVSGNVTSVDQASAGSLYGLKSNLDYACRTISKPINSYIETSDGILWYEYSGGGNSTSPFGVVDSDSKRIFVGPAEEEPKAAYLDAEGFPAKYKVICIDVDGTSGSEEPFGYGVRADGKVILGGRAEDWLEKSATKEN